MSEEYCDKHKKKDPEYVDPKQFREKFGWKSGDVKIKFPVRDKNQHDKN